VRRPHPDAVVILVAILGVLLLLAAERVLAPPLVTLPEAAAREGDRVEVEARVLFVSHARHGRLVALAMDGARMDALAGAGDGPGKGDVVRARGVVRGGALSVDRIEVILPAATRPLDPSDLARAPADFDGAPILVRGEARDGFLAGGGARVRIAGAPAPGDGAWLVAGVFRYHERDASYVLQADAWTRPP
jgi:hypothetical protein